MNRLLAKVFCILFVICGLIVGKATPPLLSPDEHSHLIRAYTLISSEWIMHNPAGTSSSAWVDPALGEFIQINRQRNRVATGKLTGPKPNKAELKKAGDQKLGSDKPSISMPAAGAAVYPPLAYFPQGLALGLAKALHLPVAIGYQMSRWMVLFSSAFSLFLAFQLITPNPLQLTLLSLPMSLFQVASASIDGFSTSIAVLAVSFYLSINESTNNKQQFYHIGLLICLLITVPARLQLWPLLGLALLSSRKIRCSWAWWSSLGTIATITTWIISVNKNTIDLRKANLNQDLFQTAAELVTDPQGTIYLLARTISDQELLSFYSRSFIGILGWLHLPLEPKIAYQLIGFMIALSTILSLQWARRQPRLLLEVNRLLLIFIALVSSLSVFILLLLAWTPGLTQASVIEGVQGRYFIVPSLLIALAFTGPKDEARRLPKLVLSYGYGSIMLLISTALTLNVL